MISEKWYCNIFQELCDDITQMDVDNYNDISVCDGDCEYCCYCEKEEQNSLYLPGKGKRKMQNKELIEMTEILMEMPEEKYQECKREFLNTEFKSPMMKDFLRLLFVSIEKHRPELVEGGAV